MKTQQRYVDTFLWLVSDLVSLIPEAVLVFLCFCPYCGAHSITVDKRLVNTMYHDDKLNYEVSCIDCYEMHDEYWRERWQEYYAGLL